MARVGSRGSSLLVALVVALVVGVVAYLAISQGLLPNPFKVKPKVKLQSQYQNPFDKKTQYVNPFSSQKNPFDALK